MFDYVINRFNRKPIFVTEDERDNHLLYIKYTEAPFLQLPKTVEEFRAQHKKKFWYNIRRNIKLYESAYGRLYFNIVTKADELEYYFDQVFKLFNARWENEYTSASWKTAEGFGDYRNAIKELSLSSEAFLAVLSNENNQILSYGLCLQVDTTIHLYQHTTIMDQKFRKFSLGKILMQNLLTYAITHNFQRFDFMAGTSPYKYEWTKRKRKIYRRIGKRSIFNYIKLAFFTIRYFVQFNPYTRKILKFILRSWERYIVGR